MKKILFVIAAAACFGAVRGQGFEAIRIGVVENAEDGFSWTNPQTVVHVRVDVTRESVRKGPYSRYSQKYLGVIAPLTDRDTYAVTGVSVSYSDPTGTPAAPETRGRNSVSPVVVATNTVSDTSFVRLPVNISGAAGKSLEDMAADAASAIFSIRKQRNTLISGDAGENVFGAGLGAAIAEYARQEEEYLSLFLGKQFHQGFTYWFSIVPVEEETVYTVCNISDTGGITDAGSGEGRPLTINFTIEKPNFTPAPEPKKVEAIYRLPVMTDCKVEDGDRVLARERIPVYQYGPTVYQEPRKK